jgi:hypothetical protein
LASLGGVYGELLSIGGHHWAGQANPLVVLRYAIAITRPIPLALTLSLAVSLPLSLAIT